jgi:alkyldihydroxyacetonephosphate synthase
VSHQHGVGIDHRDAVVRAQGPSGTAVLAAALGALDPDGRMNPGKLLP